MVLGSLVTYMGSRQHLLPGGAESVLVEVPDVGVPVAGVDAVVPTRTPGPGVQSAFVPRARLMIFCTRADLLAIDQRAERWSIDGSRLRTSIYQDGSVIGVEMEMWNLNLQPPRFCFARLAMLFEH